MDVTPLQEKLSCVHDGSADLTLYFFIETWLGTILEILGV